MKRFATTNNDPQTPLPPRKLLRTSLGSSTPRTPHLYNPIAPSPTWRSTPGGRSAFDEFPAEEFTNWVDGIKERAKKALTENRAWGLREIGRQRVIQGEAVTPKKSMVVLNAPISIDGEQDEEQEGEVKDDDLVEVVEAEDAEDLLMEHEEDPFEEPADEEEAEVAEDEYTDQDAEGLYEDEDDEEDEEDEEEREFYQARPSIIAALARKKPASAAEVIDLASSEDEAEQDDGEEGNAVVEDDLLAELQDSFAVGNDDGEAEEDNDRDGPFEIFDDEAEEVIDIDETGPPSESDDDEDDDDEDSEEEVSEDGDGWEDDDLEEDEEVEEHEQSRSMGGDEDEEELDPAVNRSLSNLEKAIAAGNVTPMRGKPHADKAYENDRGERDLLGVLDYTSASTDENGEEDAVDEVDLVRSGNQTVTEGESTDDTRFVEEVQLEAQVDYVFQEDNTEAQLPEEPPSSNTIGASESAQPEMISLDFEPEPASDAVQPSQDDVSAITEPNALQAFASQVLANDALDVLASASGHLAEDKNIAAESLPTKDEGSEAPTTPRRDRPDTAGDSHVLRSGREVTYDQEKLRHIRYGLSPKPFASPTFGERGRARSHSPKAPRSREGSAAPVQTPRSANAKRKAEHLEEVTEEKEKEW
ncbi:hypothetical protein SAICODRAFT_18287 [Saitoella complicata NRRL Y-17804]|uniref:Uncharacterized protein n=1 Tax=Saitoella complicata (strain BCRC 22490 / CBS 7301 / JCM 7358 / NBRC 10748 / NRRL Y-17804) TaxID=698492 RepID=A0A0E9NFD6_SAICN|nr:uncharacterized protein SAICODRAFT_18287 [Saitoella complicata NRRL Y-17804]ODQ54218.1 hypothetical protein SAICODRAFT_18287 [Saitoella complicata NRRL Y-17804]GAO48554.1 hypothetical protein G7K_2727-t1 [Saitoella complicata NRRL Y-17804]